LAAQPFTIEGMDRDVCAGVRGDRGVVADVVPVAMRGHDELEVQPRSASSSAIQASDGVAVSIAMASFERASASRWTLVRSARRPG